MAENVYPFEISDQVARSKTCYANMPQIFKDLYPKTRCIIDCSEIFIECPLAFQARAQTYSNYKKHNTVKILIAITPNGCISFISQCWEGRATDKFITMHSGLLNLLEHGDTVLADRGLTVVMILHCMELLYKSHHLQEERNKYLCKKLSAHREYLRFKYSDRATEE